MEAGVSNRSWFSPVILYSILVWSITCFIGTCFVILQYGIFLSGFIAVAMTFFFALLIWAVPFAGFLISDLCLSPGDPPRFVMFKDLIRKAIKEGEEAK